MKRSMNKVVGVVMLISELIALVLLGWTVEYTLGRSAVRPSDALILAWWGIFFVATASFVWSSSRTTNDLTGE